MELKSFRGWLRFTFRMMNRSAMIPKMDLLRMALASPGMGKKSALSVPW